MRARFFKPFDSFEIPVEFMNPPLRELDDSSKVIWGPYLGLLLNTSRDNLQIINEWKQESCEVVLYIQDVSSPTECLISWWTHRQHIFSVTEQPRFENEILILKNTKNQCELWLRKPNMSESHIHVYTKSIFS